MCGIAGYRDMRGSCRQEQLRARIESMTQSLSHRGPDSGGLWIQADTGIALGHRRLAIRDLSPLGHQPMVSQDQRYVLVYNGEIYNTAALTQALNEKGLRPQGASDTEVLLLACMAWGVDATLERLLGMFAFALWDRQEYRLTLARDRFGVKPLYWMQESGGGLAFASELKTLCVMDDWQSEMDHDALALLLRYGYIPAPHSIWKSVRKLPAGHRLVVEADGRTHMHCYWDALAVARAGLEQPLDMAGLGENACVEELSTLLMDAVRCRMVADVPIGAFLSGGVDSSLVTALMQQCSAAPIRTFSIGFEEDAYNEAPHAAAVARHLGTNHTELYVRAQDAWDLIPRLPYIYDEPFADASQIPTTLLSQLTRCHVATALTGDGGDELFAGYDRYAACLKQMPPFPPRTAWRSGLGALLRLLSPEMWDKLALLMPARLRPRNAGARLHNFAELRLAGGPLSFYHRYYMQYWWHPSTLLQIGAAPVTVADERRLEQELGGGLSLMQYVDSQMYLAEDILTKVDRASMSCSLEARVPLLDARVFAFAWRIPEVWRMRHGQGKYLLRRVLHKYVPPALVERPKMGFGIPVGQWLRGPLRDWAETLLDAKTLREQGIFRPEPVRTAWERHRNGVSNWEYLLWIVLMFQAWHMSPPLTTMSATDLRMEYA